MCLKLPLVRPVDLPGLSKVTSPRSSWTGSVNLFWRSMAILVWDEMFEFAFGKARRPSRFEQCVDIIRV